MKAGLSRFLAGEYVRKAQGEASYWWRIHRLHETLVRLETQDSLAIGGSYTLAASLGGRGVARVLIS